MIGMLILLAVVNGGLLLVLLLPGPEVVALPWESDIPKKRPEDPGVRPQEGTDNLLADAGIMLPHARFLAIRLGGAVVVAVLGTFLLGPVTGVCAALASWLAVQEWLKTKKDQRLLLFADHFREVLQSIANSLRAGKSLPQAIEQAYADLTRVPGRAGDLLAHELSRVIQELKMGNPIDNVLLALAGRVPLEEIRLFADAVTICRVRGGNLVTVLQTLVRLNVDRFQVRQEIRVQTAAKRGEGNLLCALPVILLVILSLISPDYMAPLTHTALGQAVVGAGLFLVLVAFLISRALTRIEV